jgi:polyhydroxybutyrate depolymerase
MSNGEERVYYLKLPGDYTAQTPHPLIFAFHGHSGSYKNFTGEGSSYDLERVVGNEAILVYPNALPAADGITTWNHERDLVFFNDLYRELEQNICFDTSRVFAAGHSAGAGFVNALGCARGDVLRGIAPVAGALLDHENCIGQVAVIQIQGASDTAVPLGMIKPGRDYWIAINSCAKEDAAGGVDPSCVAYGGCDHGYPVDYCEHAGGHEWPDFASDAIWTFFTSLPPAAPSEKTGSGDVEDLGRGLIHFKIHYPTDFVGTPDIIAVALYPPGTGLPLYTAPSYILNFDLAPGNVTPGDTVEYKDVEINLLGVDYGSYTLAMVIYVAGSNYPIPTSGVDYIGMQEFSLAGEEFVVETPFELELVDSF